MPKLKTLKVGDLKLDSRNANLGTKRGRSFIEGSLKKYGLGRSILLDKSGNVIAGNKTLEAFKAAGGKEIIVVGTRGDKLIAVQREDLTIGSKKGRSLAIADNRASELDLDWNPEVLASLDLNLGEFFNDGELKNVLGDLAPEIEAPEPKIDQDAALQKKWQTKRGQIWEIGKHRLMCGDSMQPWDSLLNGAQVDLALTDPPYGVGVEYGEATKDDGAMVEAVVNNVLPRLRKFPVVLLTSGHRMLWTYPRPSWVLAWVHPAGMGRCPWGFLGFNPILAYGDCPYLKSGKGSRPDALVLAADREGVEGHPTPKPIKVWTWLLERGSPNKGEKVFDPFLGSGTTMCAAQLLERVCYGMEIEPKYVAVALERLSDMGLKPKLAKSV